MKKIINNGKLSLYCSILAGAVVYIIAFVIMQFFADCNLLMSLVASTPFGLVMALGVSTIFGINHLVTYDPVNYG